jgi:hypothetical protein
VGFRYLILCSGLLAGCASNKVPVNEGKYPSGKNQFRVELDKENRKNGRETWWYEDGQKKYEANNDRGVRQGMYQAWYPNGTMWYRGQDAMGKPDGSLIYWHPNGKAKTVAVFKNGKQVSRQDFDSTGVELGSDGMPLLSIPATPLPPKADSLARLRSEGIQEWSGRVRTTVESYWVLPKEMLKNNHKATAKIKVARNGKILRVQWLKRSPSVSFNNLTEKALKKVDRFPPFPASVPDADLEIQYEFETPGPETPARKLLLKGPASR